jgi:hypothetical protein
VKLPTRPEQAVQAGHAWCSEERRLRALLTNQGLTISVFAAVAITAMFRRDPAGLGHSDRAVAEHAFCSEHKP